MKFNKEVFATYFILTILFATMVLAVGFDSVTVVTPSSDANIKGEVLFNITVGIGDGLSNASNATFVFLNYNTGAVVYNITVDPADAFNDTFNVTIDTRFIADGQYNLTVNVTNSTGVGQIVNDSITNLTIDGTAPTISAFNNPAEGDNFSSDNEILNITTIDATTAVSSVQFNVTNGTADTIVTASNVVGSNDWNATINISLYDEGTQTLTAWVNDTLLNNNKTESVSFVIDRTAPTVSILNSSISSTDTTPTVTFNFTDALFSQASCTLYLDGTGYGTNATTLNNTNTDITASSALSAATYTAEVNCTDGSSNVGNSSTISVTVTAAASSSSSSSSSSSGGGGGATGSSGAISTGGSQYHKEIWTSLNEGDAVQIDIDNDNLAWTEISFDALETMWGTWLKVSVQEASDLPNSVGEVNGIVHSYVDVYTSTSVKNELIENVVIEFKVALSWLEENSLSASDIQLYHFADDGIAWEALETEHVDSDSEYVYYSASSPGFSYFAIAQGASESTVVETPAEETEVVETETTDSGTVEETVEETVAEVDESEAAEQVTSYGGLWLFIILVIVGVIAFAYWQKSKKPIVKKPVSSKPAAKSKKK